MINDALSSSMTHDMQRFIGLMMATIASVLFLMFRRISGVILPLLVVVMSLLSTMGRAGGLGREDLTADAGASDLPSRGRYRALRSTSSRFSICASTPVTASKTRSHTRCDTRVSRSR